jgi:pimeloyl-ACP methyl ester carboxylesterase
VAESFGGCLACRLALQAPQLVERLVLVNPATCFGASFGGVSSLIAQTGLLSLFPEQLYEVGSLACRVPPPPPGAVFDHHLPG